MGTGIEEGQLLTSLVIPSLVTRSFPACPTPRAALVALIAAAGDVNAFTLHQFVNGLIVTACLCGIPIAVFAILYGRYNSPPVKGPEFLHEPPADLPPAVVDALFTTAPTPARWSRRCSTWCAATSSS